MDRRDDAQYSGSLCPPSTVDGGVLTPAENKWRTHRPEFYRIVIEMSGDRVQAGRFEVAVRGGEVVDLKRNGLVIGPTAGQDGNVAVEGRRARKHLGIARPGTSRFVGCSRGLFGLLECTFR